MTANQAGVYERIVWLYNNGSFSRREARAAAHWCGQPEGILDELLTTGLLVPTGEHLYVAVTPIQLRVLEELAQQFGSAQFTRDDAQTVALWSGGDASTVEQLLQRGRIKDHGHDVMQIATVDEMEINDRDEIELEDPVEVRRGDADDPGALFH